jgi:hypothetical protein
VTLNEGQHRSQFATSLLQGEALFEIPIWNLKGNLRFEVADCDLKDAEKDHNLGSLAGGGRGN